MKGKFKVSTPALIDEAMRALALAEGEDVSALWVDAAREFLRARGKLPTASEDDFKKALDLIRSGAPEAKRRR